MPSPTVVLLLLLLSSASSFTIGGGSGAPLAIAQSFQNNLDNYVHQRSTVLVEHQIAGEFRFDGCKNHLNKPQFVSFLLNNNQNGHVTEARADKNKVIYRMDYGDKKVEAMISKIGSRYFLKRAQEYLC